MIVPQQTTHKPNISSKTISGVTAPLSNTDYPSRFLPTLTSSESTFSAIDDASRDKYAIRSR